MSDGAPLGITYEITQPLGGCAPRPVRQEPVPVKQGSGSKTCVKSDRATERDINREAKRKRFALQRVSAFLLPNERVAHCLRRRIDPEGVKTWLSEQARAFYSGLLVCGWVWGCPVCASKISERRRVELFEAIRRWMERGGTVFLLTLTIPHHAGEGLEKLLNKLTLARRLMRNRKGWKRIFRRMNLRYWICALEVTVGPNGWHCHTHELLFCLLQPLGTSNHPSNLLSDLPTDLPAKESTAEIFSRQILPLWQSACVSAGLPRPNEHGVDLRNAECAAGYASKWGLECEMTKSHIKKGKEGQRSPWDLLGDFAETGDCDFADWFKEYASAFKGKHQLSWSKGLRADLGIGEEKSDQDLVTELREKAVLLGMLSPSEWALVLKTEARAHVLEAAEASGWPGVQELLKRLERMKLGVFESVGKKDSKTDRPAHIAG